MKSLAAGLSVRCFRLTTVTSLGEAGNLTGNTFSEVYLALNRSIEPGSMVKKRRAASRYMVTGMEADETQVRGTFKPPDRNVSSIIAPATLSEGGRIQGSSNRSASLIRWCRTHL